MLGREKESESERERTTMGRGFVCKLNTIVIDRKMT